MCEGEDSVADGEEVEVEVAVNLFLEELFPGGLREWVSSKGIGCLLRDSDIRLVGHREVELLLRGWRSGRGRKVRNLLLLLGRLLALDFGVGNVMVYHLPARHIDIFTSDPRPDSIISTIAITPTEHSWFPGPNAHGAIPSGLHYRMEFLLLIPHFFCFFYFRNGIIASVDEFKEVLDCLL